MKPCTVGCWLVVSALTGLLATPVAAQPPDPLAAAVQKTTADLNAAEKAMAEAAASTRPATSLGRPVSAMGGLLGLGMAAYAGELLTFLWGLWLYRRAGYNSRILFLAHFDWGVVIASFKFGVFEMLGSMAWALGQAAEIAITQARLINYAEIWGNWARPSQPLSAGRPSRAI